MSFRSLYEHRILVVLVLCLLPGMARAQSLLWSAECVPYFDNREYAYSRTPSATLFATRLSPTIGIGIGNHSIVAGVSWIQPIDSRWNEAAFKPTIYYRYDTPQFAMSMGLFPRTQLIEPLDDFIASDSLTFFSPNIQGALFQHRSKLGYVEALVDWRGLPTHTTREAFMVVAQGRINITPYLFAGGAVVMNHLARAKDEQPEQITHVTDNLMIRPYVGVDFSHCTPLDSLTLRCGYLGTFDRERGITDWLVSHAFVADLTLEWRFLGLRNKLYYGMAAQPLYDQFAATLYQGEAYYTAAWHDRLDVYGYIFRNSFVNCYASVGFYFTPDGNVGCRQVLTVRAYIDQNFKTRHKSGKHIRNIF